MSPNDASLFYLGRVYDPATKKMQTEKVTYDPSNLTTHGIVTGMTGSGKTGLCIALLEEAALKKIPALIVDPKGDLTNLLLHFPNLDPKDFEPWLDAETARRDGKPLPDLAQETATNWRTGLQDWGLGTEQLQALQKSVCFTVFTPASKAARPINILSTFQSPGMDWEANSEALREKISSNVTALLRLVGFKDVDPLKSREHILMSNIIEHAWRNGQALDMTEILLQIQKPPFERLGAFPVNSFFPEKDRFELAMQLNNLIASPSFQTWLEGEPLDIAKLLYLPDGTPRHSIFYLAHLADEERMFFVTLLLAAVEAWMRGQSGTSSLRALLYFDELVGYLPPIENPPSRPVLLRLLKQARAFGLGLLLATQNPVDVDYKALSNAGTWFIGRLQTERDKERLMDGLTSSGGTVNTKELDNIISSLPKRTFLLHSVYNKSGAQIFQTRWVLNYLAGPLTRAQLPGLSKLPGIPAPSLTAAAPTSQTAPASAAPGGPGTEVVKTATTAATAAAPAAKSVLGASDYSSTRPSAPTGTPEIFLPTTLDLSAALAAKNIPADSPAQLTGIGYHAALIAQAEIRYTSRPHNVDFTNSLACLVTAGETAMLKWENFNTNPFDPEKVESKPQPNATFAGLPGWLSDARRLTALKKDFGDWILRSAAISISANEALKVYAEPKVSPADFREMCSEAARRILDDEQKRIEDEFKKKIAVIEKKITRQQSEVEQQQSEVSARNMEVLGAGGSFLLGLLGGRKQSISSSLSKGRQSAQAKAELEQEQRELDALQKEFEGLQKDKDEELDKLKDQWGKAVTEITKIPISPAKKDIFVQLFAIAWQPHYLVDIKGEIHALPAYQ